MSVTKDNETNAKLLGLLDYRSETELMDLLHAMADDKGSKENGL